MRMICVSLVVFVLCSVVLYADPDSKVSEKDVSSLKELAAETSDNRSVGETREALPDESDLRLEASDGSYVSVYVEKDIDGTETAGVRASPSLETILTGVQKSGVFVVKNVTIGVKTSGIYLFKGGKLLFRGGKYLFKKAKTLF